MSEQNKKVIRKIREEIVGSPDLDRLDGLFAENYRYHGGSFGELEGADAFKNMLGGMSALLADYSEHVLDQVAEGNKVVSRIGGGGRLVGELMGVPGDGRRITTTAIVISAFNSAGKIEEEWVVADTAAMFQPPPE